MYQVAVKQKTSAMEVPKLCMDIQQSKCIKADVSPGHTSKYFVTGNNASWPTWSIYLCQNWDKGLICSAKEHVYGCRRNRQTSSLGASWSIQPGTIGHNVNQRLRFGPAHSHLHRPRPYAGLTAESALIVSGFVWRCLKSGGHWSVWSTKNVPGPRSSKRIREFQCCCFAIESGLRFWSSSSKSK